MMRGGNGAEEPMICPDCKVNRVDTDGMYMWCGDCFEKGLHKDFNDHFNNFMKDEIEEMNRSEKVKRDLGEV
ncbi:MAG: hypothetical protein IPQ08_06310 [Chitinophagaceae bacterium]|nr:hypothetical protein [Chitinophagaceae bacterium]